MELGRLGVLGLQELGKGLENRKSRSRRGQEGWRYGHNSRNNGRKRECVVCLVAGFGFP
jgi:hypothetical protein